MVSLYRADGSLLMGGVGFLHHLTSAAEACKAIIRRFDRAPLEDRLLRANPAQPPKGKDAPRGAPMPATATAAAPINNRSLQQRPDRKKRGGRDREQTPRSAFATELAKVL